MLLVGLNQLLHISIDTATYIHQSTSSAPQPCAFKYGVSHMKQASRMKQAVQHQDPASILNNHVLEEAVSHNPSQCLTIVELLSYGDRYCMLLVGLSCHIDVINGGMGPCSFPL